MWNADASSMFKGIELATATPATTGCKTNGWHCAGYKTTLVLSVATVKECLLSGNLQVPGQ